jgi:hypothetical protein
MKRRWVVFEAKAGSKTLWAWCQIGRQPPGFDEVLFTEPDGVTIVDAPTGPTGEPHWRIQGAALFGAEFEA